jgi:Short repeat of unknown function (DUF308)
MARGIERAKIFRNLQDREDLLCRLEERARAKAWMVYAWALFTGFTLILEERRMDPQVTDRGLMTTIGILVAVTGVVLLIWPKSGLVTMAWVIAFAALLVGALFVFLALRLKKLKERRSCDEPEKVRWQRPLSKPVDRVINNQSRRWVLEAGGAPFRDGSPRQNDDRGRRGRASGPLLPGQG